MVPPAPPGAGSRSARLLAAGAAALYLVLAVHAAWLETPTVDEFGHVPAGAAYLVHGRFDLYGNNPPLAKELFALPVVFAGAQVPEVPADTSEWGPWIYGTRFLFANADAYLGLFFRARLVVVGFGLALGLLFFFTTRRRYGEEAAAVVASLWWLSPSVIGHSHLATIDVACALTVTGTVILLGRAAASPTPTRWLLGGALWGVALLTKFSAALLLPGILVVVAREARRRGARAGGLALGLGALGTWLALNGGMAFAGTFTPFAALPVTSERMAAVAGALPSWCPALAPRAWWLGFDVLLRVAEEGEFGGYFLGEVSQGSFALYDVVVWLVKTPLPAVLLLPLALRGLRDRLGTHGDDVAQVACAASVGVVLFFFNRFDLGVRYLLPLYALSLLVLAPAAFEVTSRWRGVTPALVGLGMASALLAHPGHLGWFNALALGRGPWMLADSNVDWGQDLYRVPGIVEERGGPLYLLYFGHVEPGLYGVEFEVVPRTPVEGVIVVSHEFHVGLPYLAPVGGGRFTEVAPDHAAWLRAFEPVAREGSLWVYDTRGALPKGPQGPQEAPGAAIGDPPHDGPGPGEADAGGQQGRSMAPERPAGPPKGPEGLDAGAVRIHGAADGRRGR